MTAIVSGGRRNLNLFQSAFTNWCPMMTFLRKFGVKPAGGV